MHVDENAKADAYAEKWRGIVKGIHDGVTAAVTRARASEAGKATKSASCWPACSVIDRLQRSVDMFTPVDLSRNVLPPLSLLLSQCLCRCPVSSVQDLGRGVRVAKLMLHVAKTSRSVVPEGASPRLPRCDFLSIHGSLPFAVLLLLL